jgi:hypothetical protein
MNSCKALLQVIKNAHNPTEYNNSNGIEPTFEEQMEAIEEYAEGKNIPPTLSQRSGLTEEQFPAVDKLNQEELKQVIDAFQEMMLTWNLTADLPENLPVDRAYPLLINLLKKEAWYLPGGFLHFDFCTGFAPDCELREYCACKEFWEN